MRRKAKRRHKTEGAERALLTGKIAMPYSQRSNVYNSRIAGSGMSTSSLCSLRVASRLLAVFLLSCVAAAFAIDWSSPEAQLASKIATVTGPGAITLDTVNRSSLAHGEFDQIIRGLQIQLGTLGLRFVNADRAAATVKISLSEDLQNYVWIAEIHQGAGESSVVIVSIPRGRSTPAGRESTGVVIHKALLWSQPERILDVAVMDGVPAHMAVLDATQVALYRLENGRWQPEQFLPISHMHFWPRDLRGRLMLRTDHLLDAYLPGILCRSTTNLPLALQCRESDDPWPLSTNQSNLNGFFAPSRNYFTGALAPGVGKQTATPPFYSAAALARDNYTLWLFAATDGQVHLLDGLTDQTAGKLAWGSDITSIHSGCGSSWSVLATSNVDRAADSLQVFDVPDREPVAASQPVTFRGPITALWAEANGNNAIAVSHNLETGDYEAFRISFTCGQ